MIHFLISSQTTVALVRMQTINTLQIIRDYSWMLYSSLIIIPNIFIIILKLRKITNGINLVIVNFLLSMVLYAIVLLGYTNIEHLIAAEFYHFCHQSTFVLSSSSITSSLMLLMLCVKYHPEIQVKKALKWIAINFIIVFSYTLLYSVLAPVKMTVYENNCYLDLNHDNFIMFRTLFEMIFPGLALLVGLILISRKSFNGESSMINYVKLYTIFQIITFIFETMYDFYFILFSISLNISLSNITTLLQCAFNIAYIFHPVVYYLYDENFSADLKRIFYHKESFQVLYRTEKV